MSKTNPIKDSVQFTERTAVPKEQSNTLLFDVFEEDIANNKEYCQLLMDKLLIVPYAKLPDFFSHHCQIASAPLKWLNKLEKLIAENEELFVNSTQRSRMIKCYTIIESKRREIEQSTHKNSTKFLIKYINAGSETRCFSFKETREKVNELSTYMDKIIFLTKEKYDYEQTTIDFINPQLPDFAIQCQKEIDHLEELSTLVNTFSIEPIVGKSAPLSFNKLKINCNINQLVDIYYRLSREMHTNGRPIIEGSVNDLAAVIVNSFVDKDGKDLSLDTVKTVLTPSKTDKRPKDHKKIDLDNKS
ncbi:hypothetical protein M3B46_10110 [Sphingobacterium daejeonense]|uniref:hypothetical protein n=1 Tax=Sphingobacterium daejeonense TaxID=371142 RepID=UPI0021A81BCF|nr:hypothetical protein [Sphingobacterium daejeonense]MCT1531350.1 hypothetical protein [Sphingobacterium daejeonense]